MNNFRNTLRENFSIIPNILALDNALSWKAKGIFLYLASRPDHWNFYMKEIEKNATDGRDSLQSGIKELTDNGYLVRERVKDEDGKFSGYLWKLTVPSSADTGNRVSRQMVGSSDGIPIDWDTRSLNNIDNNNTDNNNTEDISARTRASKDESGMKRTKKPNQNGEDSSSKPSAKERTKKYLPFAEYLSKIVKSQKNIEHSTQMKLSWAADFRKLHEINKVAPQRMKKVLKWYRKNAGGKYIPVVESGSSFREKFTRLEDAIKRGSNPAPENRPSTGAYLEGYDHGEPDMEI